MAYYKKDLLLEAELAFELSFDLDGNGAIDYDETV